MVYKVIRCEIANDGTLRTGKRKKIITWPVYLRVGGLYFLEKGKLYIVDKEVQNGTEE